MHPIMVIRYLVPLIVLCAFAGGCDNGSQGPVPATEFWVSPNGDDGAAGTADAPFASLEGARDAIRALPAARRNGYVVVTLRGGTYRLKQPLLLDWRDSDQPGRPIVYRAATGERPVIVGSLPVQGWSRDPGRGFYMATVDKANSRQLYVNGNRAASSSFNASGFLMAMVMRDLAAPEGVRRPCSHS